MIITDKLRRYAAAKKERLPSVEPRRHKGLPNRAENSQQPTRARERRMRRFQSPGPAQRVLSASRMIAAHFRPHRHRMNTPDYRAEMQQRVQTWRAIAGVVAAA